MATPQHLARLVLGSGASKPRTQYVQMRKSSATPLIPDYLQVSARFREEIEKRKGKDQMRIQIKNLDDEITAIKLKNELERYGDVGDVTIERDENTGKAGATVYFDSKPHDIPRLVKACLANSIPPEFELLPTHIGALSRSCPAESLELGQKIARHEFCPEFSARSSVSVQFQGNRRMVKIAFRRKFADTTIKYIVEMKFQDMDKGCIQIDDLEEYNAITIHLRFPPMYWRYDPNMEGSDPLKWSTGTCLRRVVDIPKEGSTFKTFPAQDGPVEPFPTNLASKLGRWTVIRLIVGKDATRNLLYFEKMCKEYNLLGQDQPIRVRDISTVPQPQFEAFKELSFEVRYLLESALSFGNIVDYDLTPRLGQALSSLEPLKASMILEQIISSRERIWDIEGYIAQESAKLSRVSSNPRIVPPQCVYLRKVIVTPTTIHLQSPTVETSNRIVRHFSKLSDYFLRVEFSDEGNSRVWSKDAASNENNAIYNRIFSALTSGVKIGNRDYQFLAFSASQLRDNAAWFFCSQEGSHTVDSIHQWMGDFSSIKSIAKYAARMGQCFSSTRAITSLSESQVKMIDDIQSNNHNFSDGCGRISGSLAQMIGIELEKETVPAAFQIRLGGSKGVLVWHKAVRDGCVEIRASMKKFNVAHYVLEVIKTSGFIPSYLNRQIIILLSALGVPDKVILDLKDKMVQDLEKVETDEMTAVSTLIQNWDENGTSKMMVAMIRAGFLQTQDPFIKNLLTLFKLHMLEELSKKARIFVPKGAYLLGVCDETSQLKEGEIFIQVSSVENPTKRRVIEGKCAVVRCPCFHPGDIRIVRAVDCLALRHLHDVVVFNTKGTRGIPSMCSGGDLDGDDYTVIWDPDIVNNIKQHPPMDYTGRDSATTDNVQILDIKRFFVQYAVSNNLGLIANAHLALSDYLDEGPLHGKCMRLAQLHSDAVDFPKSGKPAEFTSELRPKVYPDFMEKPSTKSYTSTRVLGKIYRDCSKQETFVPKDNRQSCNTMLLVGGYEAYMDDARRCKALYDDEVRSLMNQYGVRSDLEVASGFIMGVDMITNKKEHDVRKSIVSAYSIIKRKFRTEFEREFYAPDSKAIQPSHQHHAEMKAAAWYAVCYQDLQPDQPYTFAWVIWDIICKIALRVRKTPALEKSSLRAISSQMKQMISHTSSESVRIPGEDAGQEHSQSSMSRESSEGPVKVSSQLQTQARFIPREEPQILRADITVHAGSVFVGPDVDDSTLKAALRF
ncbi:hypothetical protein BGX27_006930 [Mortierella sp. AM989]|nr:hypothetical protein BGX27_006930 [Mortierella sp. AM989]